VKATLEPRMNFYPTPTRGPCPRPMFEVDRREIWYLSLVAFRPDGSTATIKAIYEPLLGWDLVRRRRRRFWRRREWFPHPSASGCGACGW